MCTPATHPLPRLRTRASTHGAFASSWAGAGSCPRPGVPRRAFLLAEVSPRGRGVTDPARTQSGRPSSRGRSVPHPRWSEAGGGVRAPGHPAGSAPPPGFLGADSHGYREIFISIRWAPEATEADTRPRTESQVPRRQRSTRDTPRAAPAAAPAALQPGGRGAARRGPPGPLAGGRDPEPAPGGGRKGPHSPPGGGSGSSRSLASRCH